MRSFLELLRQAAPPSLDALPMCGARAPWMSDADWRDHLLCVARGHLTVWSQELHMGEPQTEARLRAFHAGPFLTPPIRSALRTAVACFVGWSASVQPVAKLRS